jgi:hypothetical protein
MRRDQDSGAGVAAHMAMRYGVLTRASPPGQSVRLADEYEHPKHALLPRH